MNEKSINEVVKEFKEVFGLVEFTAVNNETGMVINSKGYVAPPLARLTITGEDYIALGHCNGKHQPPSEGVIAGLLRIEMGKRK